MNPNNNKIRSSIDINDKPKNFQTYEFTKIVNPEHVFIGDYVVIDDFCFLHAKPEASIRIGSWVHLVNFSSYTGGPITIGNFVTVSGNSRLMGGTDHYGNGALMNSPIPEKYRHTIRSGCILEDFCFIGANSCIFPGITIGEGAVIGAGSIVRSNLEPWGIYIMRNGKMLQIKSRDKEKTYKTKERLLEEYQDTRLFNIKEY